MNKKIFITGGTGFIGQYLINELVKEKYNVIALVRKRGKLNSVGVEEVKGDLSDVKSYQGQIKGVDVVFHLAAIRGENREFTKDQYLKVNANGTNKLAKIASKSGVKKFIFVSSVSVSSELPNGVGNECSSYSPSSLYGESKVIAENILKETKWGSMEVIIVRPGIVYGVGDNGFVYKMICLIKKGFFIRVGNGENLIPLIYIDDLVKILMKIILININRLPIIAVSPEKISLNNMTKAISTQLHIKPIIIYLPKWVAIVMSKMADMMQQFLPIKLPISEDKVKNLSRNWWFDASKSYKLLGYCPKIKFNKGIKIILNREK